MFGYEFDPEAKPMCCHPGTPTPLVRKAQFLGNEWNSLPQDMSSTPRILHVTAAYLFDERVERLRGLLC
jgi:hypothetical protein